MSHEKSSIEKDFHTQQIPVAGVTSAVFNYFGITMPSTFFRLHLCVDFDNTFQNVILKITLNISDNVIY
jgi:hypothetical protein